MVSWFWPFAPSELLRGSRYSEGGRRGGRDLFLFWLVGVEEMMASSVAACFCGRLCLDSDFWADGHFVASAVSSSCSLCLFLALLPPLFELLFFGIAVVDVSVDGADV